MQWLDSPAEDDIRQLARTAARAFENGVSPMPVSIPVPRLQHAPAHVQHSAAADMLADMGNFLFYGGVRHTQNPELSEAAFRAWIRRSLVGGGRVVTNKDRDCMRIMYPPGSIDRSHDRSLDSSTDPDWRMLEEHVDMESLWTRYATFSKPIVALLRERFGDHPERAIWRSSMTVVAPSSQGRGLGKMMNHFILEETRRSGMLWGHACLGHTVRVRQALRPDRS